MPIEAMFSLAGRRALVTGGATGIGAAIAAALAEAGASVAITANRRGADDTLAAIAAAGAHGHVIQADLAAIDAADAERIAADAEAALGGLDILVNNAGIITRSEAEAMEFDAWRRLMTIDAAWLLCQAAGRRFLAAGSGRIVNVGSVLSFQGGIRVAAYAAAKHALVGMTRALANEWAGRGVNVNAVAPGYTATANTAPLREDPVRRAELLARVPAGRFAEPEEIAGPVVFLCADAAAYCHGSVLAVDGGWLSR
jgi:2-deoxy-D-gluconate 3-dehydrogenase